MCLTHAAETLTAVMVCPMSRLANSAKLQSEVLQIEGVVEMLLVVDKEERELVVVFCRMTKCLDQSAIWSEYVEGEEREVLLVFWKSPLIFIDLLQILEVVSRLIRGDIAMRQQHEGSFSLTVVSVFNSPLLLDFSIVLLDCCDVTLKFESSGEFHGDEIRQM